MIIGWELFVMIKFVIESSRKIFPNLQNVTKIVL